jgi:transcriptional regulator with XRE-family HTH domain
VDDARLGLAIRAIRRRRRWRQIDLAAAAHVSQATISELERGHLDGTMVRVVRKVVTALDGRATVDVRWRGAALDRLLDQRHAALCERVVETLEKSGWNTRAEVSYMRYGERGSIDVLGWHPLYRALLVVEVKTGFGSAEETLRKHDEKVRLGPKIALDRFGWQAMSVSRVLVLPDDRTTRRRFASVRRLFESVMPSSTVDVKRWIREPRRPLAGVWFLPVIARSSLSPNTDTRERVRRPKTALPRHSAGPAEREGPHRGPDRNGSIA